MLTVKDMIAELSKIENQDQPIICSFWLAETIEFADGTPNPTIEVFSKVVKELENYDLFSEPSEVISDLVYEVMRDSVCSQCDEPCSKQEIENHEGLCMDCNELYGEETNNA